MAAKKKVSLGGKLPTLEHTGYNPLPETPNQPTKHQVPPPRKKQE